MQYFVNTCTAQWFICKCYPFKCVQIYYVECQQNWYYWPCKLWTFVQFTYNKWAASWPNQQNDLAPSKDSDQPGHSPSLIKVFAVRMKKAWVLSYPLMRMPRLIWVFAGRTVILLVLSARIAYSHATDTFESNEMHFILQTNNCVTRCWK